MEDAAPQMSLFGLIREDFSTHREGLFAQGAWALAAYRVSHCRKFCRYRLIRGVWRYINIVLLKFSEVFFGISLPEFAKIGRRLSIEHFGGIVVHADTIIGDDCLIRQNVTIGAKRRGQNGGAPTIGNRVEIGAGACILGEIRIGNNCIIGANSVVIKDVPDNSIVAGVPAKLISYNVGVEYLY